MATKKGFCKNYDECDLAAEKIEQETDSSNFVCSECGKPLYEKEKPTADPPSSHKRLLIIGGVAAAIIAGTIGLSTSGVFSGGDNNDATAGTDTIETSIPEPTTAPVDTVVKVDTVKIIDTVTVEKEKIVKVQPTAPAGATTKDLGYAIYKGKLKNGQMNDDNGILTFKSRHIIESRDPKKREAEAGERVIGIFENGHLVTGKWYKNDGNVETIIP